MTKQIKQSKNWMLLGKLYDTIHYFEESTQTVFGEKDKNPGSYFVVYREPRPQNTQAKSYNSKIGKVK